MNPESHPQRARVRPSDGGEVLTGRYPCLTLQLNVTVHQAQQSGKVVLTVREPNEHERFFHFDIPLGDWGFMRGSIQPAVSEALREIERLLWGRWPVTPKD